MMILGPITLVDCLVFVIFLAPQLLLDVGIWGSLQTAVQALPYILIRMPIELVNERVFTNHKSRTPFVQQATWFQDIVIRCVRFAFAHIPASVGAVFFSKSVALPFMYWRMLRHGYLRCPVHWEEVSTDKCKGVWAISDPTQPPDVVVYYMHGGGFSMGSSYFYLEFLLAWLSLLQGEPSPQPDPPKTSPKRFQNPAVFALEYSLVPTETHPAQLNQTLAGYDYVLSRLPPRRTRSAPPPSHRVCIAGDSAGGTLALSLLLRLASDPDGARRPGHATLISPWCTLLSPLNRNTPSDYLDADALAKYARQYLGKHAVDDVIASPGAQADAEVWRRASPAFGWHFVYGREEVFAPEVERMVERLRGLGDTRVAVDREDAQIHAWPVVALFLGEGREDRLKGLRKIVDSMGVMREGL